MDLSWGRLVRLREGILKMFRRRTLLLTSLLAAVTCFSAQAQEPLTRLGRYLGFGWGDGYHAKRTWPLNDGAYRPAPERIPAPAAPKPIVKPQPMPQEKAPAPPMELPELPQERSSAEDVKPESGASLERSVLKIGRRYPRQQPGAANERAPQ